ncbi:MAG: type I-MYXAN CRISPR-associated Cas8a1/Cmx1 [Cyanobacteriota bacterium]
MPKIELHLGDPNLTLLHRAGLAGLWMTLKHFENNPSEKRPQGLSWHLTPRQVMLQWEGNDCEVLDSLLKESFQLHKGLISLRCLDSKELTDIQTRLIVHQGILGTFLQHTSTHKSKGVVQQTLQIDEDSPEIVISYKFLESYVYQEFAKQLCDSKGRLLNKPLKVAGWLNPGAVVRHIAFSADTSFEETPEQALMLLFAPVACCYFLLQSKLQDKKAQFALVIPEVTDLEKYAKYRQRPSLKNAGYKSFYASSLGDAGLQFLVQKNTAKAATVYGVERCQVLTLGTVAWSTQQKTRTNLYTVEAKEQICETYRVACNYFADPILISRKGEGYFEASFAKELITENLARSKPWYSELSQKVNSNKLFDKLTYERGGLYQMVQKSLWDTEAKKLFVEAFHETLRHTYGQAGSRAEQSNKEPNFDRINIQIRTRLLRCKNAESLRKFIVEFWSKPGRKPPILQKNWQELMILITEDDDWKLTRDLSLLALASYKSKGNKNKRDDFDEDHESNETDDGDDDVIDI